MTLFEKSFLDKFTKEKPCQKSLYIKEFNKNNVFSKLPLLSRKLIAVPGMSFKALYRPR